jgi:hypothetical protein
MYANPLFLKSPVASLRFFKSEGALDVKLDKLICQNPQLQVRKFKNVVTKHAKLAVSFC